MSEKFYVTTPIYYVNAEPHLGHAYTTIVADVLNRYHRLAEKETYFLTGTDEHGDKIVKAAEEAGQSPQEYVDRISSLFKALWPRLNISNSDFIRTTDPAHEEIVAMILNKVWESGDIYYSEYEGLYCFGCERFYTERELVEGKCPDHQTEPTVIKESNYFFRMSRYQDWLIDHIKNYPDFIRPERYRNEVLSFLKEPLEDLCISRPKSRLNWGITLPFDNNYVTYVWFDALINYISALKYPDGALFRAYWPVAEHLVAKDILKPHGIYWPCMLKAAGIEPYRHLNVHGYWNVNTGKMSKSLGNVVKPIELVDIYGLDAFRYFLMREMVFGLDSDFSEEALVARINADLANDLGNLVSRSLTLVYKAYKGEVPKPGLSLKIDEDLKKEALEMIDAFSRNMEDFGFHRALIALWDFIGKVNKYIVNTEPWVLIKKDRERLRTVLAHLLESLKVVSVLLWPVMPDTAEKIQGLLGLSKKGVEWTLRELGPWNMGCMDGAVSKAPHLFPRVEPGKVAEPEKIKKEKRMPLEILPMVSFQDFQKLDLRVGTVKAAEPIPGSKKLLKLTVDIGEERTVVAGIKEYYSPQDLLGRQLIIVANLEPIKLMGVESRGMILAAEDATGVHILAPDVKTDPGSKAR